MRVAVSLGVPARAVTVQWLEWTASGVTIVAERVPKVNVARGEVDIMVGSRRERLIRFRRQESAPETWSSLAVRPPRIGLRTQTGGGEIVVLLGPSRISPRSYASTGAEGSVDHTRVVALPGIPPGQREVVPVFDYGLRGPGRPVQVAQGESTFVPVSVEPVGGVLLTLAEAECDVSDDMKVERRIPLPGVAVSAQTESVAVVPRSGDCSWTISGLRPGPHRITVGSTSAGLFRDITVRAQEVAAVKMSLPRVTLRGSVTARGEPAAGKMVRVLNPRDGTLVSAVSEQGGEYHLSLPEPGSFSVGVVGGGPLRTLQLNVGDNDVDFRVTGSKVTVRADASEDVTVVVSKDSASWRKRLPAGVGSVEFDDLPHGDYTVQGIGASSAAAAQSVSLADGSDEASVHLVFGGAMAEVAVFDESGAPVSGARILRTGHRVVEREPGRYQLQAIADGTQVVVLPPPGLAATCQTLVTGGLNEVVVRRAAPVRLIVAGVALHELGPQGGWLGGLDGNGCRIALRELGYAPSRVRTDGQTLSWDVENFPSVEGLWFETRSGRRPVVIGNGTARVAY